MSVLVAFDDPAKGAALYAMAPLITARLHISSFLTVRLFTVPFAPDSGFTRYEPVCVSHTVVHYLID